MMMMTQRSDDHVTCGISQKFHRGDYVKVTELSQYCGHYIFSTNNACLMKMYALNMTTITQ